MILHTLLDYDTLRFIWWLLIGVLLWGRCGKATRCG